MTFTTAEFAELARVEARGLRVPGLPIVAVEHPIAGLPRDVVRARVDRVSEAIARALQGARQTVA